MYYYIDGDRYISLEWSVEERGPNIKTISISYLKYSDFNDVKNMSKFESLERAKLAKDDLITELMKMLGQLLKIEIQEENIK